MTEEVMEKKVYIGKKADGTLVYHTDKKAMKDIDGVTKVLQEMPLAEFEAKGCLVREIDGELFFGKTDAEKKAEEDEVRVRLLKKMLADTDYVAAKISEGSATREEYAGVIADRQAWREEINLLEKAA